MPGIPYNPPTVKPIFDGLQNVFLDAVRKRLHWRDKDRINWIDIPADLRFIRAMELSAGSGSVIGLDDYADYIELAHGDVLEEKVKELGSNYASAFNCLVSRAMAKHGWGVYITDPIKNNVRFMYTEQAGPSVSDPLGENKGWLAYRFLFGAGQPPK